MSERMKRAMSTGEHGTANQAIEWALDHSGVPWEAHQFLQAWREGNTDEWPDYYEWLEKMEQHP